MTDATKGGRTVKLLIVDDEPYIVRGLQKLIDYSALGFTSIMSAITGQSARQALEENPPQVMLSDIAMPELSGIDLLKYIREKGISTKVVFLSGYPNFEYAQEALKLGAVDYLLKPVDQGQLEAALKKAARQWQEKQESEVLNKRLTGLEADALASSKWLTKGSEPNMPENHYLLLCMQVLSTPGESAMSLSLKCFASFNKADSLATAMGCICFVKDQHLVIIIQASSPEETEQKSIAAQQTISAALNESYQIMVKFVKSDVLLNTQDIPDAHRRCAAYLEAEAIDGRQVPNEESMIDKVKRFIALHYAEPLTIEIMASVACLNTTYFSSFFRKQTGIGFKDYLTHTRIEAAKQLLKNSDLKVYEIALRVGFTDARYFSETFKSLTGMRPQQFREHR